MAKIVSLTMEICGLMLALGAIAWAVGGLLVTVAVEGIVLLAAGIATDLIGDRWD